MTVDINVKGGLVCRIVFCDSDAHYRNFVVFLPNCPQWRQISNTICNSQVAKQHKQRLKHDQIASKKLSYIVNNLSFNCILKTFGAVDLENFWKNVVVNGKSLQSDAFFYNLLFSFDALHTLHAFLNFVCSNCQCKQVVRLRQNIHLKQMAP